MCVKGVAIYAGVLAFAVILFLFLPQIDLLTSRLFYVSGQGFALADWPPVVILYRMVPWITWAVLTLGAAAALWLFLVGRPIWRLDRKAVIFLLATIALGPGLLANTLLKDHWGRARPTQIEEFGGTRQFTAAPLLATECASNCSFVSGHAALGFSLVAFAFLLPPGGLRRRITAIALAIGAVVGVGRIAQGAHFLSDVVYAGLLVFGTTAALHWWIVERDGLAASPFIRFYRWLPRGAAMALRGGGSILAIPAARVLLLTAAAGMLIGISINLVDRPLALFFHARDPDLRALFEFTGRLGLTYGYLTIFGLAFVILHWGSALPRLQPFARPMRAFSAIPAFLFLSIAASGIAVDLLKFGFGRLRPKLLFNSGAYDFAWLGMRPDHWSFPSGHSATIVALTTALWCLWPQHLLFYALVAILVSLSRVAVGAHYLSDVLAGAFVALLTTRGMALTFARVDIDLGAARRVHGSSLGTLPWPCRRFADAVGKKAAGFAETRPVACANGEGCSIGPGAVSGSRIDSPSWPCVSKPSTMSAAETLSTKP
jgi:lipid A 4'-phosphatase